MSSIVQKFRDEIYKLSMFGLDDHDGKVLDLDASFLVPDKWHSASSLVLTIKFIAWSVTLTILIEDWIHFGYPLFWFAYLTDWSLLFATLYVSLSFCLSLGIYPPYMSYPTWILFSLASSTQLFVSMSFWILEYDYSSTVPIEPRDVTLHGFVMILIWTEGFLVNRVPVRLKHFLFVVIFIVLYSIWSVLQNTVCQCHPVHDDNDETTDDDDDDAIYPVLSWKKNPTKAAGILLIVLAIITPAIFLFVWYISLLDRRYKLSSYRIMAVIENM